MKEIVGMYERYGMEGKVCTGGQRNKSRDKFVAGNPAQQPQKSHSVQLLFFFDSVDLPSSFWSCVKGNPIGIRVSHKVHLQRGFLPARGHETMGKR